MKTRLLLLALLLLSQNALANKIAVVSTQFVLERKFKLMEETARRQGVDLAWTQVNREGEAGVRRVLKDASLVIVDAPRSDDQAAIERIGGKALREADLPTVGIQVMSPPNRIKPARIDLAQAQRLFDYYVGGTRRNHERLFQYLKALHGGGDLAAVPPPFAMPNGGIYHPAYENTVFASLGDYLAWSGKRGGKPALERPVVGMEISSSYLSDGQTRMLDETVGALERAGALPLVFYRTTRVAQEQAQRGGATSGASGGRPA